MKKINYLFKVKNSKAPLLFFALLLMLFSANSFAQISIGGTPYSSKIDLSDAIDTKKMSTPDLQRAVAEDKINDAKPGIIYRIAIPTQVNYNLNNSGTWEELPNGDRIWRLRIQSEGALALSLLYDKFYMPKGGLLYLYNADRSHLIGAFTNYNNKSHRQFATELTKGDEVTLEYFEPASSYGLGELSISQVGHVYRGMGYAESNFSLGNSGNCQVDVNCSEGNNWQDEKKGVAKILINGSGLCTGSLINNVQQDCTPLFLSADHCLGGLDAIANPNAPGWVFYWNFERTGCANLGDPVDDTQTTTGAVLLANVDIGIEGPPDNDPASDAPDFALFLLDENPAEVYDVYFNGFDATGATGTGGVGIHHPRGDSKKIATHSLTPASVVNNFYWRVLPWDATANGQSVTEGGSSGSPLFNPSGLIIGQLFGGFQGGQPNCNDPDADEADYGRLDMSWNFGGVAQRRLSDHLDPANTGTLVVPGMQSTPNCCDLVISCALINDITVACQEDVPTLEQDQVVILDACGDVSFTAISGITPSTGCPGDPIFIGRSITATDQAGNSETCSQTVTIISNEGPSITCPATMVETCIEDFDEAANRAMVTASAECGVAAISLVSGPILDVPGIVSNCNGATYTVTYRAEDDCGRSAECEQQIAVVNDPPTIVCPANAVIECEDEIMPAMDDVMVMTSCDVNSTVTFSDPVMIGQANCNLTVYQVTYTATDVCGRQATCTQSLTIENEGPSITIPADMTLACDEPTDPGEGGGVAVASYTGEPQGWPDNGDGSTGLVATLNADVSGVPAGAVITDVNVKLVADHSWVGDLELEMLSPDGTTVELLADVTCPASGNSDNVDVTFDDEGAPFSCSVVTSDTGTPDDCSNDYLGGAALSGTVQPQLGTLGDFDGEDPNGTWTLAVSDDTGGDGGCFSEFEVIVSYAIPGDGTGTATAIASCNLEVEVTFEDEVDVTVCEGGTILRTWTATDDCGREVSEVQTLTILPALAPVITSCPGPQTVECPEDIVTTPEAVVATLDCGVTAETTVAGPVIDGPEACPGTTYTYTYTVTDECGRIDQCEQVFTIGENDAPTIDVVPTITVDCFESINPDPNLADVTTACGNGVDFSVSVTDPVLGNGLNCPGETYSVVYTITDACGRTADATQTYVIANDGPTMECPDNCEVLTCYDGDYNAIIEAWINTVEATSSCSVDLNVTNNYFGVNGICVGDFTPVTFSATDACGRSVSCESGIYIIDTDAPDIYQAPEDLLIPCTANTEQIFSDWLADYGGAEAVDACGGEVFWSADTGVNALNCANGPQAIVVTFTVTDGCGNSASVVGTFNTKLLPNAVNVAGLIQTEAAEAVASVEVAAYQSEGMTEMDMSDDNGDYNFEELPYEENTEIVPAKNDDYLNGVTTYDLILLQQHILGINTLNSPYKQIAADANRSGSISTLDLVLLRRLILHVDEELADNTSWRFVDADFVFPNPANAFESDFPEVYTLSGIEEELKDFVAVKIGDLNLDAEANSFHQSDDRSALADLEMLAEDQKLKAGQEYEVSLSAENFASINGFQFTLNFDQSAIEILDIESADLANFDGKNYGMSKVEQGAVTISWHSNTAQDLAKQDAVFTVVLRAESATQLSEVLSISSAYTKAEAYQGGELMNVNLNFSDNGGLVTAQSLKLYQNQPNPFKDATMIGFDLPKAGAVDFMIYDLTGKLVYRAQGEFAAGYNQIEVDRSDLPNGGVFYYHINTDEDAASKKMIIID